MGWRGVGRTLTGLGFVAIGSSHFTATDGFVKIVPEFLPEKPALVYISGVCEILGGVGLLVPATRNLAGWGLIALLLAVFPANIYHAVAKVRVGNLPDGPLYHAVRLPAQGLLIWLVGWVAGLFGEKGQGRAG
mgnify:CR=1 FL=1